jgi:hypothetical protein
MGDPATTAIIAGQIGGPLLSGMFSQSQQERQSFEGSDVSPRNAAERIPSGPRRRVNDGEYGQLVRAADLEEGGGDDLSKALGSVELLLQAYGAR